MATPEENSKQSEELDYHVCKVHKASRDDNPVTAESGCGVLGKYLSLSLLSFLMECSTASTN